MTINLPTSRRAFLHKVGLASLGGTCIIPSVCAWSHAQQPPAASGSGAETARVATGRRGVVASVHPLASQAAIEAFERGGNAIDAAVAASLMLSVVDGHNSGLGGGCLALLRRPDGSLHAWDGRETAPARATPEMFFRNGQPAPELSQLGPLAAGVPGLVATLEQLSRQFGQLQWTAALLGAAQVAEDGFALSSNFARVLRSSALELAKFPASAQVWLDPTGAPWPAGHVLQQIDLAKSLRSIADQGTAWFYQGEFAELTERTMRAMGGLLAASDFVNYRPVKREPIETRYRQATVVGFPPPSSGGIHHAQMLGMLEDFDVRSIFAESTTRGLHLLVEVMKRAMADRAYWLGDADFAKVPRGLLDRDYLKQRASSIDLERSTAVTSHGQPPRAELDLFGQSKHTTHLTTADADGNVVAITQTINTSFGSKLMIPGTGIVLNNEMDDFSIAPGVRNAFGLLGSAANVIAPGKRPLSSMSPTIVLDQDQRPLLSCGAAGGPKIITAVLQILVRTLDLGESIEAAIAAPRVHHQWSPDQTVCEQALDDSVVQQLTRMGHSVTRISSAAVAQGLSWNTQQLTAAADPRVPSAAAGY